MGCGVPARGGARSPGGGCAGTQQPWQVGRPVRAGTGQTGATSAACRCLIAAPEPQSPAAVAEEAPEEDEDDQEAEDPERGTGSGGRIGSLGGSGGSTAGPGIALGGALTRRAVTLRVLLKDELLEPGEGVLSIYYLVSDPGDRSCPLLLGHERKLKPTGPVLTTMPHSHNHWHLGVAVGDQSVQFLVYKKRYSFPGSL